MRLKSGRTAEEEALEVEGCGWGTTAAATAALSASKRR